MPEKLSSGPRTAYDARVGAGLSRGPSLRKKLTAAAWSGTWPAPGATLDLDFANDRGFVRGVGQGSSMQAVTFTRASNGTFVGSDGKLAGSGGNQGAEGKNLLTFPQDFDNAAWTKSSTTVTANQATAPNDTLTADLLSDTTASSEHSVSINGVSATSGNQYTFSAYIKDSGIRYAGLSFQGTNLQYIYIVVDLTTGTVTQTGTLGVTGQTYNVVSAGGGWYRLIVSFNAPAATIYPFVFLSNTGTPSSLIGGRPQYAGTGAPGAFLWGAQLELGSTATTYYPTNIGQPRFDWASTARTGAGTIADPYVIPLAAAATCNGLLIEESRTNRLLWCRDATQTAWTKTSITPAKDQTGIDGVANAASSLTATADNATCIQTITLASGSRTGSVYLKRLTGTGVVQVSLDGTTYSTVDLSSTEWRRIVLSGTVTNPVVGIRIVTNGDAVAMDYAQVEDGAFATTPILTTTATATRARDLAFVGGAIFDAFFSQAGGTAVVSFGPCKRDGGTGQAPVFGVASDTVDAQSSVLISYRGDAIASSSSLPAFLNTNISSVVSVAFTFSPMVTFYGMDGAPAAGSVTGGLVNTYRRFGIGCNPRVNNPANSNTTIKRIFYAPTVNKSAFALAELTR